MIETRGEELTDWKDGYPNTCGYMLIHFPDCIPDEPLAQKMRAIWGVGLGGPLCTQNLPGGKGPIAQICSNETENSLVNEGEKLRRTAFDFVLNSVKSLSEQRKATTESLGRKSEIARKAETVLEAWQGRRWRGKLSCSVLARHADHSVPVTLSTGPRGTHQGDHPTDLRGDSTGAGP